MKVQSEGSCSTQKVSRRGRSVEQASQIFEEHGDSIRKMIMHYSKNRAEADDIFQDLFLSLASKPIPPYVKNVKGYLHRAIKNDILDAARRTKSYQGRIQRWAEICPGSSGEGDPYDEVSKDELIEKLFEVVEHELANHEGRAIVERYKRGSSIGEGADNLGVNRRTFSRYLCIGVKNLRELASARKIR